MCRSLSTAVILSYALTNRKSITSAELTKKRQQINLSFTDLIADVSFSAVKESVRIFCEDIKIERKSSGFVVRKKVNKKEGCKPCLFQDGYVKTCVSLNCSKEDIDTVRGILMS